MQYNEFINKLYFDNNMGIKQTRNITFVVTENCNLKCTYCYETHKTHKNMSFNTAKRIVDYLFELYDQNDKTAFINKNTTALELEFIGGEPLLEIDLIAQTCDYFWKKAIELHHIWADNFIIGISSNGINYFDERVQNFIKKFKSHLSLTISIDGDKQMHDACRIHPDGSGSWDEATAALEHYTKNYNDYLGTKVTISPENLKYLNQTFKYFVERGYTDINANPIYEHEWTIAEAQEYYNQLKIIADYILSLNQIKFKTSLFVSSSFKPQSELELTTYCGGSGDMLAFDTEGIAYPCLRYMELSLNGTQKPLVIGDCFNGIYQTEEHQKLKELMDKINRRTQSDDECFYCSIGSGCGCCTAWCYQKYGTMDKRDKNICWMHRARSLANVYYWNKYYELNNINQIMKINLEKDIALKIISEQEWNKLKGDQL